MIILVSSNDSVQFYPSNTASEFTYIFSTPLTLEGEWKLSLRDICITLNSPVINLARTKLVDVELKQVTGVVRGGLESAVLKRVLFVPKVRAKALYEIFNHTDGVGLKTPYLDRLDFLIRPVIPKVLPLDPLTATHLTLILQKLN